MKKQKNEFYVLLRGRRQSVVTLNWAAYGKKGVYTCGYEPEKGDVIIKVREIP